MRGVSPARIGADLREDYGTAVRPEYEAYVGDPQGAVARFCEGAPAYWERVFGPREREVIAPLERELMGLMHTLTTAGIESCSRGLTRESCTPGARCTSGGPGPTEIIDVTGRCLWLRGCCAGRREHVDVGPARPS